MSTLTPSQFERVEAIFDRACELTGDERRKYLEASCGDDPAVRREVDELLERDGIINARPPMPERIGRYRIIRECGRGGMGTVYEAEQEDPRRRVALKLIRPGAMSRSLLRRFRQESEILGRLQHPGIAQIYEAGTYDAGEGAQPFFAMEFIDGDTLVNSARQRGLGPRDRLLLFARVCDAVHYAHQKGVIHRDLKPDNVIVVPPTVTGTPAETTPSGTRLIGETDDVGQPKILDFGVARITDADVQMTAMHTNVGQLIGTVQYMSPEQAAGDARELDVRSDIYALGVMLYELLADRAPYDLSERSIPEAVVVIREQDPARLSSVDAGYRGDVETIVGKALQKDPANRYQSASDLAADIRRYLRDEPIAARPPSTWYQLRKFARRNRALVGGAAATALAMVLGLVATTIFAIRAHDSAALATANETRALENEASALRQAYVSSLTAAAALADTDPSRARERLEAAPESLRGWEWLHLRSRLEPYTRTYSAGAAAIGRIFYTSDGSRLVSALEDGRVAVWDAQSAQLVRVGDALAGSLVIVAVPEDGRPLVACGTTDGRVRVWEIDEDRWFEVSNENAQIWDLAWDPAGARLLFATPTTVRLWQPGQPIRDYPFVHAPLQAPAHLGFTPDEARIVAREWSAEGLNYRAWDVRTGELLPYDLRHVAATAHGLSHDGTRIAIRHDLRACAVLDAKTMETQCVLRGHNEPIGAIAWTVDDSRVVTASADGTIRMWDAATGTPVAVLEAAHPCALAIARDGLGLACSFEGTVRFWDFTAGTSTVLSPDVSYVYNLAYSPDGTRLAAASSFSTRVAIIDPNAGRIVRTIDTGEKGGDVLIFSPDGQQLLTPWTVNIATGEVGARPRKGFPFQEWPQSDRPGVRGAPGGAMSPDGALLASSGIYADPPAAVVRNVETDEIVLRIAGEYWAVAFSPDGALLALGRGGGTGNVEIWNLAQKRKLLELPPHGTHAYCADFHPDGTRLATGGNDNTIRLWDTTTWEPVLELRGHTSYVKALVFSPDGTQLASGSGDLTVRIWDTIPRAERQRRAPAARER